VKSIIELFSSGIIKQKKCKVIPTLNYILSTKIEVEKIFDFLEDPFFELQSHYQQIKYFISNINLFFKPETIVVGYIKEKKILIVKISF